MPNLESKYLYKRIFADMAEGAALVGMDGRLALANAPFLKILGISNTGRGLEDISGKPFASLFFEYEQNDAFNQLILDSIYDRGVSHNSVVSFFTGSETKQLFVTTSYLTEHEEKHGVIIMINDVTELYELRDALLAMERIKQLNNQLQRRNKLISETFGRYLSDDIVKQLLDSPEGSRLGGKKEMVTILMSDLRGFTAMSEVLPPVDLMLMLNNYLGKMTDLIQLNKGTIIEFIGDAILAVFGAPIKCGDHAANAVLCAIEMQNAMAEVNKYNASNGYPALEMGIGINTGNVILGNIGSEKRAKYGIVGQNINLCGRIEGCTIGGQVLISQSAKDCIPNVSFKGKQTISPKGISGPIDIYEVTAIGDVALNTTEQVFATLNPPLQAELYLLEDKYAAETGHSVTITAISQNEALLDCNLEKGQNVKLVVNGSEVFAKAVSDNRVHFRAADREKFFC